MIQGGFKSSENGSKRNGERLYKRQKYKETQVKKVGDGGEGKERKREKRGDIETQS